MHSDQRITFIELVEVGPFAQTHIAFHPNTQEDLAEVHIFTGNNGSGKSTLLYCLASVFAFPYDQNLNPSVLSRFRGPQSTIAYGRLGHRFLFGKNLKPTPEYPVEFYAQAGFPSLLSSAQIPYSQWVEVMQQLGASEWQNIHYTFLPLAYSGQRLQERTHNSRLAIQDLENSPLENHLYFGRSINPQHNAQWIANTLAKEAFALKDGKKEQAKQHRATLDRVIDAIREIAGDDFSFFLNTTTLDVSVHWRGSDLPIALLPDGLKSIISWLTDVLMRMDRLQWEEETLPVVDQPLILFLDEIDIHLHPQWQRKILPVIQKLFRNAQIFVSTHSPFVVGSVQDAWVYKLNAPNNQIQAIHSGAGRSYEVLLEEVFDIAEHYDTDTQGLLSQFKNERRRFLQTPTEQNRGQLTNTAEQIAQRSEELDDLIALELRQLKRHGHTIELSASQIPENTQ